MKKNEKKYTAIACVFIYLLTAVCLPNWSFAQKMDTIQLTVKELDKKFLEQNLLLLANRTNIDIAKALTEQAKLWDNPVINTDNNLINFQDKKVLDNKQIYVQVQQLFRLGGKRKKLVALQEENERLTTFQFNELMRNLRFQLHSDFYAIVATQKTAALYQSEIRRLSQLLIAVEGQEKVGNMAYKDVIRIQAAIKNVEHSLNLLALNDLDSQSDLNTLLRNPLNTVIKPVEDTLQKKSIDLNPVDLVADALRSRGDVQTANSLVAVSQKNLIYQKSLSVPDLTVGVEFDRASNYVPNYTGLVLSIPIPIFNRNQGNIKAADLQIQQQQKLLENNVNQISNEILYKYLKIKQLEQIIGGKDAEFYVKYDAFYINLLQTYKNRQIGLPEFIDFYENYKESKLQQIELQKQLRQAAEELNFAVGKIVMS